MDYLAVRVQNPRLQPLANQVQKSGIVNALTQHPQQPVMIDTLNPYCSPPNSSKQLRRGSKARYGWVANPYGRPFLAFLPTGTFTLKDAPSFARRDNQA